MRFLLLSALLGLAVCAPSPWTVHEGQFYVNIPMFPVDPVTNKFVLPEGVERVYVDIGAHVRSELIENVLNEPTTFVLAFEPTPSHYFSHLKLFQHPRFLLLPMAVSNFDEGFVPFYVSEFDACNSLTGPRDTLDVSGVKGQLAPLVQQCAELQQMIMVPAISLRTILKLIPLPTVDWVKVDAQGHDLQVAQSAGEELARVKRVTLELQDLPQNSPLMFYTGSANKESAASWMASQGFGAPQCTVNTLEIQEYNCDFYRTSQPSAGHQATQQRRSEF